MIIEPNERAGVRLVNVEPLTSRNKNSSGLTNSTKILILIRDFPSSRIRFPIFETGHIFHVGVLILYTMASVSGTCNGRKMSEPLLFMG